MLTGKAPDNFTTSQKKQLVIRAAYFHLIIEQIYNMGPDEILRQYVLPDEKERILVEEHDRVAGGHYGSHVTTKKILQDILWWPTLHSDVEDYQKSCDSCQ